MTHPLPMNSKEVRILSHQDTVLSGGKSELVEICGLVKLSLRSRRHVETPPSEPVGNGRRNTFI